MLDLKVYQPISVYTYIQQSEATIEIVSWRNQNQPQPQINTIWWQQFTALASF